MIEKRWRCSVRNKNNPCQAAVAQVGDNFQPNHVSHNHQPDPTLCVKKTIYAKVKASAGHDMFRPALDIVEEAVRETVTQENISLKPKNLNIKRVTNMHRAKSRPPIPKDIHFEIDTNFLHVDDFLVADLHMETYRHLIFSTPFQLDLLQRAKRWFIDGTFKIVGKPFGTNAQLWSINSFVSDGQKKKQFPMVYVIMTRRRKTDYVDVFRAIIERIGEPTVETFVSDFESAAWQAVKEVFPGKEIKGCVFHWTKAVFSKAVDIGLKTAYTTNRATKKYIQKFLALPFLPTPHIRPTFENLAQKANTDALTNFVDYIRQQWMNNDCFDIDSWCVYDHSIRTNNHIEAWHRRLNSKGTRLSFYKLVAVLQREAEWVRLSVEARDLETEVRRKYTKIDKDIADLWQNYRDGSIRTSDFLIAINRVYKLGKTKQ